MLLVNYVNKNILVLITFYTIVIANDHVDNNPECDAEEQEVEECGRRMVLIGRQRMPQTVDELNKFCSNYKKEEKCLRNHSVKCLSPSAHQTVTILINSVVSQNQRICSKNWRTKKLIISGAKCLNKLNAKQTNCLQQFIDRVQGIHQLSQNAKMPVICCNYHKYRKCATNQVTTDDHMCDAMTTKTIESLIDGYSGDVINYVCDLFKSYDQKCDTMANMNAVGGGAANATVEEIPKSFFSLMVKLYLS
ncbi:uncharacterized protein LOC128958339 [Oppia nitens]|uniref:uncharacterized protein LOC128958339 n=1 Tax=Oppia nitens TaxID=1686743 RepID=UPI0023DB4E29|nr:uncharacterized protein LOC128958339 [Oppia nitens]